MWPWADDSEWCRMYTGSLLSYAYGVLAIVLTAVASSLLEKAKSIIQNMIDGHKNRDSY